MNSRLSAGERYDQLMRAKSGEVDVMIGPRSALFTPFPKDVYKRQSDKWRYCGWDDPPYQCDRGGGK